MLKAIHPKLPMRDKAMTRHYYVDLLGFQEYGDEDYPGYLMLEKDDIQIHFFEFRDLNPEENYGQVYIRVNDIDTLYQTLQERSVAIHPNGRLENKPWRQREFSLSDPDFNLLTFGEGI